MILISLFVVLMILSAVANIIQAYLGIPEITSLTQAMHSLILLVVVIKYGGIMIAFLVQQYERKY
jgi:hypothetical protein